MFPAQTQRLREMRYVDETTRICTNDANPLKAFIREDSCGFVDVCFVDLLSASLRLCGTSVDPAMWIDEVQMCHRPRGALDL